MKSKNFQTACNIAYGLLTAALFYLMPFIAWHTMAGDKTDILLGMGLGFIPIGLLLLSFLYGFLTPKVLVPACMAAILGIPAVFIPVVAGETLLERGGALLLIAVAASLIACVGAVLGILLRRLLGRLLLSRETFSRKKGS